MIDYEEDWLISLIVQCNGSVVPKAFLWTMPSMILALLMLYLDEWWPGLRDDLGMLDVNKSQLWTAATGVVVMMLGFRTRQAWGRFWEGTGLLHQMRGEWFDTVSNCITFSIAAKPAKYDQVIEFRHTIIRIMSLCHGSALEEIAGNQIELESIDCFGLSDDTLHHLMDCHINYHFNKVEVMLHMLQTLITKALDDGILKIPAPILSRVYQTISRGFVNLLNAKKITDTKFPFPYAQLITILLFILEFVTPLLMTALVRSKVLCVFITAIPIFGLFSLNFVAQELEDPFGNDDNDLPLGHFQTEMNNCLMMLLHPNSDIIAGVGPRCELDFHNLLKNTRTSDLDDDPDENEEEACERKTTTKRLSEFDISRPMHSFFNDEEFQSRASMEGIDGRPSIPPPRGQVSTVSRKSQVPHPASRKSSPISDGFSFRKTSDGPIAAAVVGSADPSIAVDLDTLAVSIAQEPLQHERMAPEDSSRMQTPRMQEPMCILNSTTNESIRSIEALNHDTTDATIDQISRIADLQPMLAKNMDALIGDLQKWTINVHREVDSLNQNSAVLQNALQRFGDGLPDLRRQTGHSNANSHTHNNSNAAPLSPEVSTN